jgi:hypothetical protein
MFHNTMLDIVRTVADPETVIKYFINIFCHSALPSLVGSMKEILQRLIQDDDNFMNFVIEFFTACFAKLKEIFLNCSSPDIMALCIEMGSTDSAFNSGDVEVTAKFLFV